MAELPYVGSTLVDGTLTLGDFGLAIVRKQFHQILSKETDVRVGEDPEGVHQMRVACRRLRTAVGLFGKHMPPFCEDLRNEAGWLAAQLGMARDADVQLQLFDGWITHIPAALAKDLEPIEDQLREKIAQARTVAVDTLATDRYAHLIARYPGELASAKASTAPPVLEAVPKVVEKRMRRVVSQAETLERDSPDEDYHRLRILAKRARYSMEFVAPLYGPVAQEAAAEMVKVQDCLGTHQDESIGLEWIQAHLPDSTPKVAFALGALYQWLESDKARLRKLGRGLVQAASGRTWIRLKNTMASKLAESLPDEPAEA